MFTFGDFDCLIFLLLSPALNSCHTDEPDKYIPDEQKKGNTQKTDLRVMITSQRAVVESST